MFSFIRGDLGPFFFANESNLSKRAHLSQSLETLLDVVTAF